jgi:DNA polymerase-3 subunit gamma/tau
MTTLYRKYRPQTFSSLVGQEYIVQTITNELKLNKLAQAYLFSGPRGTGKTTLARLLAKAVNCEKRKEGEFEPCDTCTSCQEITAGRNVDVIEIDAASQTGVDNVRENIIENAQFKPTRSKYKVFIVDEVHMLSTSAFNALLKTLEEPPAHVMFILATTELHKLPATVISRCQRFQFKKIPFDLMESRLKKICAEEDITIAPTVLQRIIAKSDGCLRDAESLLGQIFSLNLKNITEDDVSLILPVAPVESILTYIQTLADKDTKASFEHLQKLAEDGANFDQFTLQLLEVLRTTLIFQTTQETNNLIADYNEETIKSIQKLASLFSAPELLRLLDLTLKRKQEIKSSPVPQLPLELLAVEFTIPFVSPNEENTISPPLTKRRSGEVAKPILNKTSTTSSSPLSEIKPSPESATTNSENKKIVPSSTSSPIQTTIDQIKEKWNDIVLKLSTKSASLVFIAKMSEPRSIDAEGLHLIVAYDFHKEKLMEAKNRKLIEDILEEIFHEKFRLQCEYEAKKTEVSAPIIHGVDDTELGNLAAAFGGEVVG